VKPRILCVDDDAGVAIAISYLLRTNGYVVATAADGAAGLRSALEERFDLLILDLLLPGMNGFEVSHAARERGFDGAILILTGKREMSDRIRGLRVGADDYLVKPFDSEELLARVGSLLRRVHREQLTPVIEFKFGNVKANFGRRAFSKNGKAIRLAEKEAGLLRSLINHRGQVMSRSEILQNVWSEQRFITGRTVDVHIAWLRRKLEDNPRSPRHIVTIRGEGYRFDR